MVEATNSARVNLNTVSVAELERFEDGDSYTLRFLRAYQRTPAPRRPVLGLYFEDAGRRSRGFDGFPAWFANLLPEGPFRSSVARAVGCTVSDHWELLLALGEDLPGAVRVIATEPRPPRRPRADTQLPLIPRPEPALAVSLAGVQPKISLRDIDERGLVVPLAGKGGDVIAKLHDSQFPGIARIEGATTAWARAAGVCVPDTWLADASTVEGLPENVVDVGDGTMFVTRRFDRSPSGRIHVEDFAQILDRPPQQKYDGAYEVVAAVVGALCSSADTLAFLRQLAFCVMCGNSDAHLKNWAILYRDGVTPTLTPGYDLIAAVLFPKHGTLLAMPFFGERQTAAVGIDHFEGLARLPGVRSTPHAAALSAVKDVVAAAKRELDARELGFTEAELSVLRRHIADLQLVKDVG